MRPRRQPLALRLLRWVALVVGIDLLYLAAVWPDWVALEQGAIPKSNFITRYERLHDTSGPPLRWTPVTLSRIARPMQHAVIAAEDSRFYSHGGIDWDAVKEAAQRNYDRGELTHGASTISQQTAKNLFLSPARTPWRKWHELVLTYAMEQRLEKRRILELYLNIAEFGPGIYGVEAAARVYFGVSAAALSKRQAAELAASLPSPRLNNPATQTRSFLRRAARIERRS